jgi:putative FmdB family regulatory protein
MPIYAYRCESCGHAQDVLQKISDPVLTHCPACGAESYKKQVTAAGFQLKGTGWYVTDFRGGSAAAGAGGVVAGEASGSAKEAAPAPASDSVSTDSAPAAAPTPSGPAPSDS